MNLLTVFCAFACTISDIPNPSDNFFSWISPEITEEICSCITNCEAPLYLDYNGDNQLTVADAICVARRYEENVKYGTEITIDAETVDAIIEQNYNIPCIYWEFCEVNNEICRQYEVTASKIVTAKIYFEFEDYSTDFVEIEINPFEEIARVIDSRGRPCCDIA